jgi:phage tail sheath protein FI
MPEYLYPGVYVEEIDTGNKPIEGVSTSTVGFLGIAERGPTKPTLITSFGDYTRAFGRYVKDGGVDRYLAYAVEGFFQNGGKRCFVQRVAGNTAKRALAKLPNLTIWATGPGVTGNNIAYQIGDAGLDPVHLFKLTVLYWAGTPPADLISNPTMVEVFDNLSSVPGASTFYESEINDVSNLVVIKQTAAARPANNAGAAVLNNAGIPILLQGGIDGAATPNPDVQVGATATAAGTALAIGGTLILTAGAPTVTFTQGAPAAAPIITVGDLITAIGADAVVGAKAALDATGHLAVTDPAGRGNLAVTGTLAAAGAGNLGAFASSPTGGPPPKLVSGDFIGFDPDPFAIPAFLGIAPVNKSGLAGLGDVDEVSILCCPDENYLAPKAIAGLLTTQCETMKDRFAILQAPSAVTPPNDPSINSKYAAYYYPWLKITNPLTGVPLLIPPGGHIAGIYARSDTNVGVHKDPANEVINGIDELQLQTNDQQQAILNPKGVDVLRYFRGAGNLVWGGRTTATDPDWKYINVRRLFIFIEKSILRGTQWVVFEINDEPLWARVRRSIGDFLTTLWRDRMLQGTKKEQAFFVKCDRTTMTQADIDNGRLICVIGIAAVKPAEFVIFRIGQWYGGFDVSEG